MNLCISLVSVIFHLIFLVLSIWVLSFFPWWFIGSCYSSCIVADIICPCSSSLFLAISVHLSFVGLWMGWNQSGSFLLCPQRLGKLVVYPSLPFLMRGTLSSWGALSWHWAVPACMMGWYRQNEDVLPSFFVPLCCRSFLHGFLSSQSWFCSWIAVKWLIFVEEWKLCLPLFHLGDINPQNRMLISNCSVDIARKTMLRVDSTLCDRTPN